LRAVQQRVARRVRAAAAAVFGFVAAAIGLNAQVPIDRARMGRVAIHHSESHTVRTVDTATVDESIESPMIMGGLMPAPELIQGEVAEPARADPLDTAAPVPLDLMFLGRMVYTPDDPVCDDQVAEEPTTDEPAAIEPVPDEPASDAAVITTPSIDAPIKRDDEPALLR
jgi:hypothetical protein